MNALLYYLNKKRIESELKELKTLMIDLFKYLNKYPIVLLLK